MSGIVNTQHGRIIINGGEPLAGCPTDANEAKAILDKLNEGKEEFAEPMWSFDCGYKLNFDGGIVTVSSRFYPPKTHYGATWDGAVTIRVLNGEELKRKFDCPTVDQLKSEVEDYIKSVLQHINNAFKSL